MSATQWLLQPYRMGQLELANRIVMAPLTRSRATDPDLSPTQLHVDYYSQRASAGVIFAQLCHTGALSHPELLGGAAPLAPSAVNPQLHSPTAAGNKPTVVPRAMSKADIRAAIGDFAGA